MAHIDLSRVHAKAEFKDFCGVDRRDVYSGNGGLAEMSDFRITPGKYLKKRCGFKILCDLPGKVRAVYKYSEKVMLVLAGDKLYRLSPSQNEYTLLCSVSSSEGSASFIHLGGELILLDGNEIYVYSKDTLSPLHGYAPLYGKEWDNNEMGEVNEPFNMACNRIRVSFRANKENTTDYHFPFPLVSVVAVFKDGEKRNEKQYIITGTGNDYIHTDFPPDVGMVITFYLTVDPSVSGRNLLTACRGASVYGNNMEGLDNMSAVFYGGEDPSALYPARKPGSYDYGTQLEVYPDSKDIYVPSSDAIFVNNGQSSITATCRKGNSLMVFTSDNTFIMASEGNDGASFSCISTALGCSSEKGVLLWEDYPITVSYQGIYRWSRGSDDTIEYVASPISLPLGDIINNSFCSSAVAFPYRKRNEIWFCSPDDPDKRVWIYSMDHEAWYSFSGVCADCFFEHDGEVGFFNDSGMYIFSEDLKKDLLSDGEKDIVGKLGSNLLMFGDCNVKKRLSRFIARVSPGAEIAFSVTDPKGRQSSFGFVDTGNETPGYIEKRLSCHRARHYAFTLECRTDDAEIYGIILTAAD